MNVLAHAGLGLAGFSLASYLLDWFLAVFFPLKWAPAAEGQRRSLFRKFMRKPDVLNRLRVDYRLILLGSILPDLIDKPLFLLVPDLVNDNLRSFGHTLIFNVVLLLVGVTLLMVIRSYNSFLLAVACNTHIILDRAWRVPKSFFWPYYGWDFRHGSVPLDWWLGVQFSSKGLGPLEVAGGIILLCFVLMLVYRRSFWYFLKTGTMGNNPSKAALKTSPS